MVERYAANRHAPHHSVRRYAALAMKMNPPQMRHEGVRAIGKALQGCYSLTLREKLPLVAIISTMAVLAITLSVHTFVQHPTLSKGFFTACGYLLFGLLLVSIVGVIWSGRAFISETQVGFSAYPPFWNWTIFTKEIERISLLEHNGVYHIQFHMKNIRKPTRFLCNGNDLHVKIDEFMTLNKEG